MTRIEELQNMNVRTPAQQDELDALLHADRPGAIGQAMRDPAAGPAPNRNFAGTDTASANPPYGPGPGDGHLNPVPEPLKVNTPHPADTPEIAEQVKAARASAIDIAKRGGKIGADQTADADKAEAELRVRLAHVPHRGDRDFVRVAGPDSAQP